MKKLLFTLLLSLLTLAMSAQIQRTFLGNTLGVSTCAQVKSNMIQKGYRVAEGSGTDCLIFLNVKFAGCSCEKAFFYFHNKKLYMVSFLLEQSFIKDSFNQEIEILKDRLIYKYPQYITINEDDHLSANDGVTAVSVACSYLEEYYLHMLSLGYIDNKLMEEKIKSTSDEL